MLDVVRETAKRVFVPLCVGGGISTIDDFRDTLRAGADKVSVNSSALGNPDMAMRRTSSEASAWWWPLMPRDGCPAGTVYTKTAAEWI